MWVIHFKPVHPSQLPTSLISHFPPHQPSYACSLTTCIPIPIIHPLPSPTHTFSLLFPSQIPFIFDSPSTPILYHPSPKSQIHVFLCSPSHFPPPPNLLALSLHIQYTTHQSLLQTSTPSCSPL